MHARREEEILKDAFQKALGDVAKAARIAGCSKRTMQRFVRRKRGLDPKNFDVDWVKALAERGEQLTARCILKGLEQGNLAAAMFYARTKMGFNTTERRNLAVDSFAARLRSELQVLETRQASASATEHPDAEQCSDAPKLIATLS